MLEMMVTAANMNQYPSIFFQSGDDFAALHIEIIHTIHTASSQAPNEFAARYRKHVKNVFITNAIHRILYISRAIHCSARSIKYPCS